jgi:hypothetical protein
LEYLVTCGRVISELKLRKCSVKNEMRKTGVELVLKADCHEHGDDVFIMKKFLYDRE